MDASSVESLYRVKFLDRAMEFPFSTGKVVFVEKSDVPEMSSRYYDPGRVTYSSFMDEDSLRYFLNSKYGDQFTKAIYLTEHRIDGVILLTSSTTEEQTQ